MFKTLSKILIVLILGIIGGILSQILILPYLSENSYFEKFQFIKNWQKNKTVVSPVKQVIIQEDVALVNAVEKVKRCIVGIRTQMPKGGILRGSGIIVTADGLAITLAELVPPGSSSDLFWEDKKVNFKVLKRDTARNLVLLELEKRDLPTIKFADAAQLKPGAKVFLVGALFKGKKPQLIVNAGFVKYFDNSLIHTNIFELPVLRGSSLFGIEGDFMGLNIVDAQGKVNTISVSEIREFAGL